LVTIDSKLLDHWNKKTEEKANYAGILESRTVARRTVARRTDARRIVARISLARTLTLTPSYPHHHTLPRTLTLTHTIVYCEHVLHEQVSGEHLSGGQLPNEQVSVNRDPDILNQRDKRNTVMYVSSKHNHEIS
jgi:hypothetical protein